MATMKPNGELTEEEANTLKVMLKGHPGLKSNGDLSPELTAELREALGIPDTSSQVWSYRKNVTIFIISVLVICFVCALLSDTDGLVCLIYRLKHDLFFSGQPIWEGALYCY